MTQTMPEKLELIARCIREGREVEVEDRAGDWDTSRMASGRNGYVQIFNDLEYRAKPEKPRYGTVQQWNEDRELTGTYKAYEDTPEVRQALEDAGLI